MVEQRSPKPSVACSSRVSPATSERVMLVPIFSFYIKSVTRSTVPPLQMVMLSLSVRLQAPSQQKTFAASFMRV